MELDWATVNNSIDMRHTKTKSTFRFIFAFLLITMISCRCFGQHYGQNLNFTAFDTNGPMGKCLFPINEKGEDEIKEVILFQGKTADEISEQVKKWAYEIKDTYNLKIDDKDRYMGVDLVAFRGSVKLGLSVLSIDYAFAHIGDFARYASEIKFCCRVEIKDGKCRCIFNNFMTDRRTIPGEGKSNGPENRLHWQRVNSLVKERDELIGGKVVIPKRKQAEVDAYNEQIRLEEETYQLEYNVFANMINDLKGIFTNSYDF